MKDFETVDSAEKVYDLIIKNIPANTLISIFFDADDTLITPQAKTFKKSPYNQMIDRIKENKSNYDNYEEIVSNWRLQRKVILIDEEWVEVINKLKEKFPVYALTQMNTGEFSNILSMQDWRYKKLKSLDTEFSDNEKLVIYNSGQKNGVIFYKGIFITGNHSKSSILSKFSEELNASFIVFVDDRTKHVEDVRDYCKKNKIGFFRHFI